MVGSTARAGASQARAAKPQVPAVDVRYGVPRIDVGHRMVEAGSTALAVEPDSTPWPKHPEIGRRVRTMIGDRWGVPAELVSVHWGRPAGDYAPTPETLVFLSGSGGGGYWFVELTDPKRAESTRLRVRAAVETKIAVAARPVARIDVLTEGDIARQSSRHWGDPRNAAPVAVAPGWIAHRALQEGDALAPPSVRPPDLVRSGSPIRIDWVRGGLRLTVGGRALRNAGRGEEIYVRTDTGQRVKGVVTGPGRVELREPARTGGTGHGAGEAEHGS